MSRPLLEVCVDTPSGLAAAVAGGADRIELCAALDLGGLTPSAGLVASAARLPVPARAIIRPHAGGFLYRAAEREAMLAEIESMARSGIEGVVIGAHDRNGRLDVEFLSQMIERASGLGVTLHRAVDLLPDGEDPVQVALDLGIDTILTSGRERQAIDGVRGIADLVARADGRVTIMAGSGINPANAASLIASTGVRALHASCRALLPLEDPRLAAFGFAPEEQRETDAAIVRHLRTILDELEA